MRRIDDSGAIEEYYARRAGEYERIYAKPERQADLRCLREWVLDFATGRRLLEIACGTGYWTELVLSVAPAIVAIDSTQEVLAVARAKGMPSERVSFVRADAFRLETVAGEFNAAFAGFWWSHVPRTRLSGFLGGLHRRLGPGTPVMFFDNRFVEDSSTPVLRTDHLGNTYQIRVLADRSRYEILKNFPSGDEVREAVVACGGLSIQVRQLEHYWAVIYEIGDAA